MKLRNALLMLTCLTSPAAAQIASFQHVVVIVQENRTPDNFFQGLCSNSSACSTSPTTSQYNIQTSGWLNAKSPTGVTQPKLTPFGIGYDMNHGHSTFLNACNKNSAGQCQMNGWIAEKCISIKEACPKQPAYAFVDPTPLAPYTTLATSYGWANYFFQTNQGASFPAHQYIFGATSAPSAADDHNGIFASTNPSRHVVGNRAGCAAIGTQTVQLVNPDGVEFASMYPCFEHQTLGDVLLGINKTWRYYGDNPTGIWMAPNAISHICQSSGFNGTCTGSEWKNNVEVNSAQVLADITTPTCALRNVVWIMPDGTNSDHAGLANRTGGPSWVASIVNAVGQSKCKNADGSSYWNTTAIFVVWDDWGGWYDHVQPQILPRPQGGYQMGFRVPLIVVSAYTPQRFISNTPQDFGSLARFIEHNFGLPEGDLTFADQRATSDLAEYFHLGAAPRPFTPIPTALSIEHFLTTPPSGDPPDDD